MKQNLIWIEFCLSLTHLIHPKNLFKMLIKLIYHVNLKFLETLKNLTIKEKLEKVPFHVNKYCYTLITFLF